MPFQFDIPSFLLNLRLIQQHFVVHQGVASQDIIDPLDWKSEALVMVDLLEMEIEGLLWNNALKPCERKELKALYMLRKSEAMAFYRNPNRTKRPKFKMLFCNPSIIFPNCLLDALCRNAEFQKQAQCVAMGIANELMRRIRCDYPKDIGKDELELLVRSFPLLLSSKFLYSYNQSRHLLGLLPFLERLRMELGFELNENRERVVELILGNHLWDIDKRPCTARLSDNDDEVHEPESTEITSTDVIDELRSMDLFRKEDITQSLLKPRVLIEPWYYCIKCTDCSRTQFAECSRTRFAETRFRFLVDMEPRLLARNDSENNGFPLHRSCESMFEDDLCAFTTMLELGVKHFPDKLGFLFHRNRDGKTPLELAYNAYTKVAVDKVVNSLVFSKVDSMEAPEAMLVSLAMDEHVHFEAIYNILRRYPSILAKVSSQTPLNGNRKQMWNNPK